MRRTDPTEIDALSAIAIALLFWLCFPTAANLRVRAQNLERHKIEQHHRNSGTNRDSDTDWDLDPDAHRDSEDMDVDADFDTDADSDQEMEMDVDVDLDVDNSQSDSDSDMPVQEQETIQKTFALAATGRRALDVDNIFGSIEVTGGALNEAQLVVKKTIRAETKDALERAKKEVTLDITDQPALLRFYVNGPFRCCHRDCFESRDDPGYVVKMDFQLRVPHEIDVKLKTVNEGRVVVQGISGNFVVGNVNGDIEMADIAGSGTAHTVNGPVKVTFRQNPRENSSFQTVNGDVELHFTRDLSADFRFKTFNGGVYSDFPVSALPVHAIQEEHRGPKTIFRADRFTGARVRSGGPEIKIENLNGDIRILQNHE